MADNKNKVIHKRSSVTTNGEPKLPSTDALDYGEIAINYADGAEVISLKNNSNEIVEFRSKEYYKQIIDKLSGEVEAKNVQAVDTGDAIDDVSVAYATEAWVNNQGFLISTSLNDYATKNFVTTQGYLKSDSLNGYATKVYVDSACSIPVENTTSSSKTLTANIYYRWTNTPSSLSITLATPSNSNILNNYMFEFTASSSGCSLSLPSSIKWINGTAPNIEGGKTYQISIINNLATVAKFG